MQSRAAPGSGYGSSGLGTEVYPEAGRVSYTRETMLSQVPTYGIWVLLSARVLASLSARVLTGLPPTARVPGPLPYARCQARSTLPGRGSEPES